MDGLSNTDILKGRTAIIAGSGQLPQDIAAFLAENALNPFIFMLKGDACPNLKQYPHCLLGISELAKLFKTLKKEKISNIILAGGVKTRPQWRDLHLDWPTIACSFTFVKALYKGDDALLRAFITILEARGYKIIGAHEVMPELLSPTSGTISKRKPDRADLVDIKIAAQAAKILGQLDIGQGAIAVAGRVVALEGAEGTDNMLKRIIEMRAENRIPPRGGVLLKRAKPEQEQRADLPTIGLATAQHAHQAGLNGIALEAERGFILDYAQTLDYADTHDLFLTTFDGRKL